MFRQIISSRSSLLIFSALLILLLVPDSDPIVATEFQLFQTYEQLLEKRGKFVFAMRGGGWNNQVTSVIFRIFYFVQ
eukprot:UN17397